MLSHLDADFRHVEDLAALHPADRASRQASSAPPAAGWLMPHLPVRPGHLPSVVSSCPSCPPGLRSLFFRSDRGFGGGLSRPPHWMAASRNSAASASAAPQTQRSARVLLPPPCAARPPAPTTSSAEPASSPGSELQELPASTDAFVWLRLYQVEMAELIPRAAAIVVGDEAPCPAADLSRGAPHVRAGERQGRHDGDAAFSASYGCLPDGRGPGFAAHVTCNSYSAQLTTTQIYRVIQCRPRSLA